MSITESVNTVSESINKYMDSAEKTIYLQKEAIAKLREIVEAKNTLNNTLMEYIKKIYDVLETGNDKDKEDAMWHLRNLCYPDN